MTKPRYMVHQIQQSTAPWCLFNSITKEVGSTNIALRYLLLKATSKKLDKKEVYFDCFDRSYIWGFGNIQHQSHGKT